MTNQTPESVIADALRHMVPSGDATMKRESQAYNIAAALSAANMLREPGEPQAESEYVYCPIHGDLLAARRSFVCEHAEKGHEYAAQAQPSSTVNEAALSDVLSEAVKTYAAYYKPEPFETYVARAVAEYLTGGKK